ncbi:MAG TPA: YafY family protein [Methylophilaceae bacterium]|jgi:predicted DNA-binding transcriptional regulator YafY
MSMTERFHMIHQMLESRSYVTFGELQERLEVSRSTLKRDLAYMRDRLHAPIVYDRELGGYCFDKSVSAGGRYVLPGLWFSAEEIHALLTMQHLLSNLHTDGLLGPHIEPLLARLITILGGASHEIEEIRNRIKLYNLGARGFNLDHFESVASAVLQRKRLIIEYHARSNDEVTVREISPQRLVHYRGNWYVDAWCHMRDDIRNFSVDAIRCVEILKKKAKEISERTLNRVLGAGYGIFGGRHVKWATLIFTPERARWVAAEHWHPQQSGRFRSDGRYELRIPYSDDRELIMDILRHGSEVEVIAPASLREKITRTVSEMAEKYLANFQK